MQQRNPSGSHSRDFEELTGVSFTQEFVEFVIPDLDRDLEKGMYLTVALAAIDDDPLIRGIYDDSVAFFKALESVLEKARTGDMVALAAAKRMTAFPEAGEIGFGYTRSGWGGKGVGRGAVRTDILNHLLNHPGLSLVCCVHPDALSFLDGVGLDRSSDAVASIAKDRLIEFTQRCATRYGFDPRCIADVRVHNVWKSGSDGYESRVVRLPVTDDGRPIILVPKRIVRSAPPVTPEQYGREFNVAAADYTELKRLIMEENRQDPGRLFRLMEKILGERWRYRPRRDFRDE